MLPLRFVGLLVALFAVQAFCKPAKNSEGVDYSDDDPPSDYKDEDPIEDDDDPGAFEEPPQILSRPESIRVRNGSTIWLNCLVKNADNFAITWKRGDEILYYDSTPMTTDHARITREKNNTLVIHNATTNDTSDSYECTVLTKPPVTIKHRVLVDSERASVQPPAQPHNPLIRVTPGKRVEVGAGESITLGCETRIQPTPEIKWFHENKRVRSDVIVSGNNITIPRVNRHDSGRYQCLVENGSENPPVESIVLVVNFAPEVEAKKESVHTGLGVESELTCVVHAHPHAKVTWFKGQKEVRPEKGKIEIKVNEMKKALHSLYILHTEQADLGDYTCLAVNRMGRAEKTIRLTGIPSQAVIYGGELTRTATGFNLRWQLESYSPITEYKLIYRRVGDSNWISLKPTVKNGNGNQFISEHTIEDLQPGSYEAKLSARNDFGWSEPSGPHMFTIEITEAENVEGSSSAATSLHARAMVALFLVVSSCAFTSL